MKVSAGSVGLVRRELPWVARVEGQIKQRREDVRNSRGAQLEESVNKECLSEKRKEAKKVIGDGKDGIRQSS